MSARKSCSTCYKTTKVSICAEKTEKSTCIVVKLRTLSFPPVSDGTNVPWARRADETDWPEDIFAPEVRIEASEPPLRTKGSFFCITRKRTDDVRPSRVQVLRLRGPD